MSLTITLSRLLRVSCLTCLLLSGCHDDVSGNGNQSQDVTTLTIGQVGSALWPDGSVALAIPVSNTGDAVATNISLSAVKFANGSETDGISYPVNVGSLQPQQTAVVKARFKNVPASGSYPVSIAGAYGAADNLHAFSIDGPVSLVFPTNGSTSAMVTSVPKRVTSGVPGQPTPIEQDNDDNPGAPPVPDGPLLKPSSIAPTGTGASPIGSSGSSNVTIVRDTRTGQTGTFPPDPDAAAGSPTDHVVLATGNTYLLLSTDDGTTFTRINPTTIYTDNPDGGLCCDQVATYVPSVNLFFWLIQTSQSSVSPSATTPGANRLRLAFATPQSLKNNPYAWTYVDITPTSVGLVNQALDFPDLAYTNQFLYVSVDRVISRNPATGATSVNGLIVAKISLSDLAGPSGTVGMAYLSPNETTDQNNATGARLTQSSADAMYWGGHVQTSQIEVFHWADNSGSVDHHLTNVNTWCNTDYSTLAPDSQQWLDSSRSSASSIIGSARKPFVGLVAPGQPTPHGEVWFAWGAGRDTTGASPCTQGRPQPYVKIVRVDDTTLDSVGEYHIWNSAYAFAYPSLAENSANGDIGVSVSFGGPSNYASTAVGYLGDYVVYYTEQSNVTLTFFQTNSSGKTIIVTRYGDFFTVRNSGQNGSNFSTFGYAVTLTNSAVSSSCTVSPGCSIQTHYEQWSRPPVSTPPIQ